MNDEPFSYSGGCLCGAVRYEATGDPIVTGQCYCKDCRRASGSAFIPFLLFDAEAVRFTGETLQYRTSTLRGGEATRNSCPKCGSLVFGGVVGVDRDHTIYAGTLDDPSLFEPMVAIFTRDRPEWAALPPGIISFETMPD